MVVFFSTPKGASQVSLRLQEVDDLEKSCVSFMLQEIARNLLSSLKLHELQNLVRLPVRRCARLELCQAEVSSEIIVWGNLKFYRLPVVQVYVASTITKPLVNRIRGCA